MIFGFADDNLHNLAILSKVLWSAKSLQKLVFLRRRAQTCDIDQILLHNSKSSQVFSAKSICFLLLEFFLLRCHTLLLTCSLLGFPSGFPNNMLDPEN